jgi:hypothetical protein
VSLNLLPVVSGILNFEIRNQLALDAVEQGRSNR